MAESPQTPSKRSQPDPHPSFTTTHQHRLCSRGWEGDCWLKSMFSLGLAMHGYIRFSTLGRREQRPAHLCCLHLAGELTSHFHTGAQTEGLQRTICMPIYITEYWIVTSCVLILWIFFFKVKYTLLLDSWNEMQSLFMSCGETPSSLNPNGFWFSSSHQRGDGEIPADTSPHPHPLRRRTGARAWFLKEFTTRTFQRSRKLARSLTCTSGMETRKGEKPPCAPLCTCLPILLDWVSFAILTF